jgi:PAS domain S-box-containing protein
MTSNNLHADIELVRLDTLRGFSILDTPPNDRFDRITSLVSDIFDVPIALVSLVDADRQWFKSHQGLEAAETPRDQSFCAHVLPMGRNAVMVVEDAALDPRFAANPLVTGGPLIRFYLGAALTAKDGSNLGTLCAIDTKPRPRPTDREIERLRILARVVIDELELSTAQSEVSERKRLLELAEATSGVGHWRYDITTGDVEWSDEVYRIHGVAPKAFKPDYEHVVNFYHVDDQPILNGLVERALRNGVGYECKLRLVRADGELRHVVARAECQSDGAGNTTALVGVFQDITVHVSALAEAKRREADYRLLADYSTDIIVRADRGGMLLYVSPACRALGYEPEALVGTSALHLLHPEDLNHFIANTQALFSGETVSADVKREHRFRTASGEWVWLEGNPKVRLDEAGMPLEIVNVFRDVTERRALQELAARQAEWRGLAEDIAGVGYWRLDVASRSIDWSKQMFLVYGLEPGQEPPLERAMAMVHPEDRIEATDRLQRALNGQGWVDGLTRLIRPNGEIRYVEGRGVCERDATGAVIAVFGTMVDVTNHKVAELEIAESEARYRLLAENVTDMIVTSSLEGRTLYVSRAATNLTGYSVEEATGVRTLDLVHPDDGPVMIKAFRALMGGAPAERIRWRGKHKSGDWTWLESMPSLVTDPSTGEPTGFVDVVRDVTAQVAQEEALLEARAAAEVATAVKTEFLANMSHELRTPLTSILGFSELLRGQVSPDGEGARYLDRVAGASTALMSIVNDILDFSKLEAGQVEIDLRPVEPATLFEGVVQLLAPQASDKNLALHFSTKGDVPAAALMDDTRVRQVLLNLTSNAVKFTASGEVRVTLSPRPNSIIRCEVKDTGPGVPPERLNRLFQRFSQVDASTTRAHGGTGLGLAICKGLVEAMGGEIGVESSVGRGSTFWFELPCQAVDRPAINSAADGEVGCPDLGLAGLRILVADDNPVNRELIRLYLTSADMEVTDVVSGEAAVEAAMAAPFDLILMDIRMPGRGGPASAKSIREERGPNDITPIIAFTADADQGTIPPDWGSAFNDRVGKPIVASELFGVLARWAPGAELTPQLAAVNV